MLHALLGAFLHPDAVSAARRARRAAVIAARMRGGMRTVHVRRATLLLAGETAPRRARVRAAAAAADANSGPIGTIGLNPSLALAD
jgi:hypothetical protein